MYQLTFDFGRPAVSGLPIRTHFVYREEFVKAAADLMMKGGYCFLEFTHESWHPVQGFVEKFSPVVYAQVFEEHEYITDSPTAKAWDWLYDMWEQEGCPIGVIFDPLYLGM